MTSLTIAMCQTNPVTGDFEGNFRQAATAVRGTAADVYVFPECHASNIAADDLFLHAPLMEKAEAFCARYAELSAEVDAIIVVGMPVRSDSDKDARPYNAAVVADRGSISVIAHKRTHPGSGISDGTRWFGPQSNDGNTFKARVTDGSTVTLGICIHDDLWWWDPVAELRDEGAEIALLLNSIPFSTEMSAWRCQAIAGQARKNDIPVVHVNQCGGNDELLWDGRSMAVDGEGNVFEMPAWREDVATVRFERDGQDGPWRLTDGNEPSSRRATCPCFGRDGATGYPRDGELYVAACVGLRDYLAKTGFSRAVLGLSGGADSALVLLMAADVLGARSVHSVLMPTAFTSDASNYLAAVLADGLGSPRTTVAIQPMFEEVRKSLETAYGSTEPNVAEENLQAQLRGDVLSWHSNKFGAMILSTGNKSEIAMGYSTLYGDMRGGFNPLKDLYKTEVFELMEARLAASEGGRPDFADWFGSATGWKLAPFSGAGRDALRKIIDRPPSAELSEGQVDTDTLPDYPVLDAILKAMVDSRDSLSDDEVARITGTDPELVSSVRRRLRTMEFKRFQSCPGPKIHMRSFTSKDWRMPIASAWIR